MRTAASLTIAVAALVAALIFRVTGSFASAYGSAPWCAVTNNGAGDMEWDCEFQTIEQCAPAVIAGNRGFCNLNPAGPQYVPAPLARRRKYHHG